MASSYASHREAHPEIGKTQNPKAEFLPLEETLGIEMEFILCTSTWPDLAPKRLDDELETGAGPGLKLVRDAIREIEADCNVCGERHPFQLPLNEWPGENTHEAWTVETDISVMLRPDDIVALGSSGILEHNAQYFHFDGVEVKSRILRPGRNMGATPTVDAVDHVHSITYEKEIEAVLAKLHQLFGSSADQRNEARGFPLQTVKNVLSSYVLNERAIDGLHSADRIGGTTLALEPLTHSPYNMRRLPIIEPDVYNKPISSLFTEIVYQMRRCREQGMLGRALSRSRYPETHKSDPLINAAAHSFSASDWLDLIQKAPSLEALEDLQDLYGHSSTVNLENLIELFPSEFPDIQLAPVTKHTLEFRQHAGTLQWPEVKGWMDFVRNLVRHAHQTSDTDFKQLCTVWQKPEYHSIDLVKDIGCSGDTIRFYRHRLGMRVPGRDYSLDLFEREKSDIELLPSRSPEGAILAPLMLNLAEKRQRFLSSEIVRERISDKFSLGGYGQFATHYLDELDFGETDVDSKEKLTIGWVNRETKVKKPVPLSPAYSDSDPYDFDAYRMMVSRPAGVLRVVNAEVEISPDSDVRATRVIGDWPPLVPQARPLTFGGLGPAVGV